MLNYVSGIQFRIGEVDRPSLLDVILINNSVSVNANLRRRRSFVFNSSCKKLFVNI